MSSLLGSDWALCLLAWPAPSTAWAGGWAVGSELRRICRKRHHLHPNPSTLNNRAEAVFVLECSFTDGSHLYCYGTIQTLLGSTVSLKQKWEPPPDVMGIPPPPRAAPA